MEKKLYIAAQFNEPNFCMYSRVRVKIIEGYRKSQTLISDRIADDHWIKKVPKANKFLLFILFVAATAMAVSIKHYFRIHYPPSILTGFAPNLFSAFALVFAYAILEPKKRLLKHFKWCVLSLVFYEFSQLFDQGATFDWLNINATLVGAYSASFVIWKISRWNWNFL